MKTYDSIVSLKRDLRPLSQAGARIGLVPTMGALHDGHLSLLDTLRSAGADYVVASIFVNPRQFERPDDLKHYPRHLEDDLTQLRLADCDAVFFPTPDIMYPAGFQTEVEVHQASQGLCGAHRPGHFKGVTTVVTKLLNIVQPSFVVFGEKDFQQLTVLRTLVRDLNMDVEVVAAPLVREPDGLAMSSRNARLSPDERKQSAAIYRGLVLAQRRYNEGERSAEVLTRVAWSSMSEMGLEPEYLELRALDDLVSLSQADRPCLLLTAVPVGPVRLIDNLILQR